MRKLFCVLSIFVSAFACAQRGDYFFTINIPVHIAKEVGLAGSIIKENPIFDIFEVQRLDRIHLTLGYFPNAELDDLKKLGQEVASLVEPFEFNFSVSNHTLELFDEWGVLYIVLRIDPQSEQVARILEKIRSISNDMGLNCHQASHQHITVLIPIRPQNREKALLIEEVGLPVFDKIVSGQYSFKVNSFVLSGKKYCNFGTFNLTG
ncbi:hypothetical protein HN446_00060 [bacterium]|jgi:2'-5' RNA ligase|nr:hypothetical protein [bacterium]